MVLSTTISWQRLIVIEYLKYKRPTKMYIEKKKRLKTAICCAQPCTPNVNRSPNNTKRGNRQKECLCDKYQSHSWKNRSRSTHSLCYFISFVVLIFGLLLLLFCLQKRKFIASFLFWYTSFATKQIGLMVLKIPAKGTLKTVFWTQMTKHCDALFLYYLMITNLPFFTFFPTTSKIAENLKDKYQNSWAAEAKPGRD